MAPLLLLLVTGCLGLVPTRRGPRVGEEFRFEARSEPLRLALRARDGQPIVQYCSADLVQGQVSTILADTVIFNRLTRVDPASPDRGMCHTEGAARLVVPDQTQVRMSGRGVDVKRVALLGAVIAYSVWVHTRF